MFNKIFGPKEDEERRNGKVCNLCEPNFCVMIRRITTGYYVHRMRLESGRQEIYTEVL
jgi:hypothetical protein